MDNEAIPLPNQAGWAAIAARQWRDDEGEGLSPERYRCGHGRLQGPPRRRSIDSQPGRMIEIGRGHEPAAAVSGVDVPVVAAPAQRHVPHLGCVDSPSLGELRPDVSVLECFRGPFTPQACTRPDIACCRLSDVRPLSAVPDAPLKVNRSSQ